MSEPLTTLWRCSRCEAVADPLDPLWWFSEVPGLVEHIHDGIRVSCREEPVFSEGDMQAVQERAERAEAAVQDAQQAISEVQENVAGAREVVRQARAREVELAEALRDLVWRIETNADLAPIAVNDHLLPAITAAKEHLVGVPSHELVPLGTQEALREMVEALDSPIGFTPERSRAALLNARALVEGVEPDRHSDVHPCWDCGVPTSRPIGSYWLASDELRAEVVGDDSIALCPSCFHGRAEAKDIHVSWRAVVEGVERTHTPGPLVPGAAARADALACPRCGGLPAGEASGAGDLCVCAPAPTPSGITDEMVEAARDAIYNLTVQGQTACAMPSYGDLAQAALAAAFEHQAGPSEGHTLVPNEHAEALAAMGRCVQHKLHLPGCVYCESADQQLFAARGRPQWPGTDQEGK